MTRRQPTGNAVTGKSQSGAQETERPEFRSYVPVAIRLLPRHKINLLVYDADGKPFVDLFRGCWRRIPPGPRRSILTHWANGRREGRPSCPVIQLSNTWYDSRTCSGQVRDCGLEMRFNARDFEVLPFYAARFVIAHEIAHVYRWAVAEVPPNEDEDAKERRTDEIARQWGFCNYSHIRICHLVQNGIEFQEACRRVKEDDEILCGDGI
jgi:hypothetical protein